MRHYESLFYLFFEFIICIYYESVSLSELLVLFEEIVLRFIEILIDMKIDFL